MRCWGDKKLTKLQSEDKLGEFGIEDVGGKMEIMGKGGIRL